MRLRVPLTLVLLLATNLFSALAADGTDGWAVANSGDSVTVYTRPHEGSSIRECKAVGFIDAEPIVVKRVLDDTVEYPKFMPYVVESKTLSRTADGRVGYQRISPPIVGERDYTVRVKCESRACPSGGTIYCNRWEVANDLGPAEIKGVTRVKITEGSWLLEPAGGGKTKATYTIYSDSGGGIPTFLLNSANKTAIPKLFDAVRKQCGLPKYQGK
ncbi:MAG: START domain-containing protein [Chthoniobacter sp.]|nr:START domain-containing protein [Chthoniobacter sp.]